ncbi:MAG: xanthine dehydrogenase YagR molybdenum-binding subunit [Solirubrobacteraceae bacterium]|nr:xanthine dehydrogenase YagR molybdenum-binding subunit [Solirubrobacteraceae bacterium]
MAAAVGTAGAIGTPRTRVEGRAKVTGEARYAFEHPVDGVLYAAAVTSTIAAGRITGIDTADALAVPGMVCVLSHENAPRVERVADGELFVLQTPTVAYRGQLVAAAVAASLEAAVEAAGRVRIDYESRAPDVVLRSDHERLYAPEQVNAGMETDTARGDFDQAFAGAAVSVDVTYETPAFHNNPMEPHASLAVWGDGGELTIYDSSQGAPRARETLAEVFGLEPDRVRVISPHVGGGFGSKGTPRPHAVIAALAARVTGRPVKLALTRRETFSTTGYRTPTIQRLRLGADADGRLEAIGHDAILQTSTVREFVEQAAAATRMMYAAPHRRTTHRVVALDVPTPSWMRAPGECPGMFALESALDELALACRIDPVELRIRNEPETEPESGLTFSSRNLVACLREGAARFGWADRDPTPGGDPGGRWLTGTGVAASTYPAYRSASRASAHAGPDGGFTVRVGAADIGTGARTVLTQIAADTLGIGPDDVVVEIGDSALPRAPVAGGSMGTASWGTAVVRACEALAAKLADHGGIVPAGGLDAEADTEEEVKAKAELARHGFGAQFAEVRIDRETGEVRVPRMVGIFAVGRIINPLTARSQLLGGMTMGISMALLEESLIDREFGDFLNRDLAQYHVATIADAPAIEVGWVEEDDDQLNPMGSKGIGEIGIVGTAAAVANAVHHATGVRVRRLPITLDRLL